MNLEFKKMFEEFWLLAVRELNDVHYQATETDKITRSFALVRSEQRWRALKEKFTIFEVDRVNRHTAGKRGGTELDSSPPPTR